MRRVQLACLVVVAVCGVVSAPATASAKNFHSEISTTYIFGEAATENVFTFAGGTAKCKKTSFTGSFSGTTTGAITVTPVYESCVAFGQSATISTSGCTYEIPAPLGGFSTGIRLHCGIPNAIVIKATTAGCTVSIPAQELGAAFYTNGGSGSSRDVLIEFIKSGPFSYTSSGGICGSSGSGGEYSGKITEKGYNSAAHTFQIGFWLE